jgi:hypothetical protein
MRSISLSIVLPVKNPPDIQLFIELTKPLLQLYPLIVVDSGGGEPLRPYCRYYLQQDCHFWEARRIGYGLAEAPFILNLDVDTVLPSKYVDEALKILEGDKAEAVAIDYERLQGHYAFGTSIWKTDWLMKLYDYPPKPVEKLIKVGKQEWVTAFQCGFCECTYMWAKLLNCGGRLETLPYRAKHLSRKAIAENSRYEELPNRQDNSQNRGYKNSPQTVI